MKNKLTTSLDKELLVSLNPATKKYSKFRMFARNPFGQFFILGICLILVILLSEIRILPVTVSDGVTTTVIYAIIAIGFCLLLGYSGLASLGTAGFAGIGVFAAYYAFTALGMSFFTALILSIVVAAIIGIIVGFISLRIEGMYLAILTLGLAEILFQVFKNITNMVNIPSKLITFLFMKVGDIGLGLIVVGMLVVLLMLTHNLINSPTGRAMLAMKNSTSAAQAMGISLMKYRLFAFVISTIYASIGGLLYIMYSGSMVTAGSTFFALSLSLNILGAVIVGGSKSLLGSSFGALVIFGLQTIFFVNIPFFQENPEFVGFTTGLLIILVVMFYPGGASQLFTELKGKLRKLIKKLRDKKYGAY